jgi:uncharacterized protein YndB with AHSA1/START domain
MSDVPQAPSPDGTLERIAGGGVIRFERHLPYPIDDVWDAITTPERLADWWLPFDADITIDLREGGRLVIAGRGDEAMTMTLTIQRVEPPTLLVHTHVDAGSSLRWELESVDTGCVLRLSHFVTDPDAAIENCYVVGMHTSLARLAPSLGGVRGASDWDARFAEALAHYAEIGLAPPPPTASS